MKKIGFIGCGNMGGALVIATAKIIQGENIYLCDTFKEKAEDLATKCGAVISDVNTVAKECDYIFLGVKPQSLSKLFDVISPVLKSRKDRFVLVSMAAGISVSAVKKMADCNCAVIRIMPNTPVSVGEGMILYSLDKNVSNEQLDFFINALSKAGKLDVVSEEKIDAASALSGCGPAFVYMFAEALADGAVECGLPRDKAMIYTAQTILGAAKLLKESEKHPGVLKDAVCSPGGTTIAGVHALEDGAFRSCAMNAVKKAYEKTLELKK